MEKASAAHSLYHWACFAMITSGSLQAAQRATSSDEAKLRTRTAGGVTEMLEEEEEGRVGMSDETNGAAGSHAPAPEGTVIAEVSTHSTPSGE